MKHSEHPVVTAIRNGEKEGPAAPDLPASEQMRSICAGEAPAEVVRALYALAPFFAEEEAAVFLVPPGPSGLIGGAVEFDPVAHCLDPRAGD